MEPKPPLAKVSARSRGAIRATDVILSAVALLLLSPAFLVVALILRLTGEGEVFYRQSRIGKGGSPFGLLKFATMRKDSPTQGAGELTMPGDPRVLPVGRVLRKTKINELPQLWNILIGDMSFIGPRPQTRKFHDGYDPADRAMIEKIRPGLSGVGSILFRDEENLLANVADPVDFDLRVITPYKGRLESWFVSRSSVRLYWQLFLITAATVLAPRSRTRSWLLRRVPAPPTELDGLL